MVLSSGKQCMQTPARWVGHLVGLPRERKSFFLQDAGHSSTKLCRPTLITGWDGLCKLSSYSRGRRNLLRTGTHCLCIQDAVPGGR